MASIRQRNGKWQARVIRNGYPSESKTFHSLKEAERWARSIEIQMDTSSYVNRHSAEATTFKTIVERYIDEVCPLKRGGYDEAIRLRALCRSKFVLHTMDRLSPTVIAAYRDERMKVVKPGTVIRELAYISSIINHARREWSINIQNSALDVKRPASPQGRSRILTNEEKHRLLAAAKATGRQNDLLLPAIEFSLETAVRRGELLRLSRSNIDFTAHTAFLPLTKSGISRTIPLSSKAISILNTLPIHDDLLFPINAPALHAAFRRACNPLPIPNEDENPTLLMQQETRIWHAGIQTVVFAGMCVEAAIFDLAAIHLGDQYTKYLDKLDLVSKWIVVPQLVCGQVLDAHGPAITALRTLTTVRNSLVHQKSLPADFSKEGLKKLNQKSEDFHRSIAVAYKTIVLLSLELNYRLGRIAGILPIFENHIISTRELPATIKPIVEQCRLIHSKAHIKTV